ncbi:MAG: DMT family transporter [Candidatus Nomurabacteria bacterium]|jgi:drug/metabolite transporter (DMT)-like permease|nr:DMT family transporter [Candidatus Nomurabacteria bacterium]
MAGGRVKISNRSALWILLGVFGSFIAAPNSTIIKAVTESIDSLTMTVARYAVIFVVCLPFIVRAWSKLSRPKNWLRTILSGVFLGVSTIAFALSIEAGQASYTSIILLLSPVFLVVLSVLLLGERLSRQIVLGVSVALLGALAVTVAPFLFGASTAVNTESVIWAVISLLSYPFGLILLRKVNEAGVSMAASIGANALVIIAVAALAAWLMQGGVAIEQLAQASPTDWVAMLYSALVVYLLSRIITVKTFEKVGSAVESGIMYMEGLLSVAMPMVLLGENLTPEIIAGGLMIFGGMMVAENGHRQLLKQTRKRRRLHHLHHRG